MIGMGTIINTAAIIIGGLFGRFFGGFLKERHQNTLNMACGICVLFIGIAGAMEGMLTIDGNKLVGGHSMLVIGCLAVGALVGEMINLEDRFEKFGEWLKVRTGNAKD